MWLAIALTVASVPLLLYLLGRREEENVRRDWELLLTARGEGLHRRIDEVFTVRELGPIDEAKQLLEVGYKIIATYSPSLLKMLAAMATFSRMVSAMAPAAERWRLRLYILGRSLAAATRFLLDSSQRTKSGTDDDWLQINAVRQDFQTLTHESLASLRALLNALAGQQSQQALWQLAERREQWKEAPETPYLLLWGALIVAAMLAFSKLLQYL